MGVLLAEKNVQQIKEKQFKPAILKEILCLQFFDLICDHFINYPSLCNFNSIRYNKNSFQKRLAQTIIFLLGTV